MSRILDALKKAVPKGATAEEPASSPAQKPPAIFERVILESNEREELRRRIEAKKESARLRYLLNEGGVRTSAHYPEERSFPWIGAVGLAALALGGIFALVLSFHGVRSRPLSPLSQETAAAGYELKIAALTSENSDLKKLAAALQKEDVERLKIVEAENIKLRHRLEVMLQDNLSKDQTIARLASDRDPSARD
jgi:hypothetical protein